MTRSQRFSSSLTSTIHSSKVQGALMGAPFFIGITLLFQLSEFTSWAWENVVTVAALGSCIGLITWGYWWKQRQHRLRRVSLYDELGEPGEPGQSDHVESQRGVSAHLSFFHRFRRTPGRKTKSE